MRNTWKTHYDVSGEPICHRKAKMLDLTTIEAEVTCKYCLQALKTLERSASLVATKPKSRCTCGHSGDGPYSKHISIIPGLPVSEGHGSCVVDGCGCTKFTWGAFLPYGRFIMARARRQRLGLTELGAPRRQP